MSKNNKRSNIKIVKPKSTPAIYNKIELLTTNLFNSLNNAPRTPCIDASIKRLTEELLECASVTSYAYLTTDYSERLDYLLEMGVHLSLVETIIKILTRHSLSKGSHILTEDKMCEYLSIIFDIEKQLEKWTKATYNQVQKLGLDENCGSNQAKGSGAHGDEDYSFPESTTFRFIEDERRVTVDKVRDKEAVMGPFEHAGNNPFNVVADSLGGNISV